MDRTKETGEAYMRRALHLEERGMRNGIADVVEWLRIVAPSVSPASFRLYRASVAALLAARGEDGERARAVARGGASVPARKRTSARKKKSLSQRDLTAIAGRLPANAGGRFAYLWLRAGVRTGLRPCEWATATFRDGCLTVRNAKATNGRAHGEYRTLALTLTDEEAAEMDEWMRVVQAYAHDWERFYTRCRKAVQRATAKQGTAARPALYSGRHQCAADLKAAGHSRAEVGAALGHGVDDTCTKHYGRKQYGRADAVAVAPLPEEVARVKPRASSTLESGFRLASKK